MHVGWLLWWALSAQAADWQSLYTKDGVSVSRREVPGSPLFAFRGEGVVDQPIDRLLGVLTDSSKSTDWVHMLAEVQSLRVSDDGMQSVFYTRYDTPWPITDRDYLLRRELALDADKKQVTAHYQSVVDDTLMPERDCCVRAEAQGTFWRFTATPEGTRIEVEVMTDPRGAIPSWAVNYIQREWPYSSIRGLSQRASQDDVQPWPALTDW